MKKIYTIIGILTLMLASCIEEYNAEIPEGEKDILVVDGTIVSESLCTFYVSRSIGFMSFSNTFFGELNASVRVKGSDGTEWSGVMDQIGEYQVAVGKLLPDVSYQLEIEAQGLVYMSTPMKPIETPEIMDSIAISGGLEDDAEKTDVLLYLNMKGPSDLFYRITYAEDWALHAEYNATMQYNRTTGEFSPMKESVGIGWKKNYSERPYLFASDKFEQGYQFPIELYSISLYQDYLSYRYCTTLTARAISKEEYEYEKLRNQMSGQMGDLFSPQPSTLPSNITCSDPKVKALGFVGVSSNVQHMRHYINTREVNCHYSLGKCEKYHISYFNNTNYNNIYDMGYRPVDNRDNWAMTRCVDVRYSGATLEKPDWWKEY